MIFKFYFSIFLFSIFWISIIFTFKIKYLFRINNVSTNTKKSELSSLIKDIGFKVNITLGAGDIANEVEQIKSELEYAI